MHHLIGGSTESHSADVRLSLHQVCKTYGSGSKALQGLSLSLGNGIYGLLGPNGAGKSSLMRSLATLQQIDSGSMRFDGIDLQRQPQRLRNQIGYLPQSFGVYPGASALELLQYLAILKGVLDRTQRREQIDLLLHRTHLYADRRRAVSEFSGGMRQRFGIAQALLGSPQLLIVDEPTAGLDPQERNSFHQLLCGLAEQRVVILSTHIVEDVRHLCPRLGVLQRGQLLFDGTPAELIEPLRGRLWARALAAGEAASAPEDSVLLSFRMLGGQRQLRVFCPDQPSMAFHPAAPDLEDGYFHALSQMPASSAEATPSEARSRDICHV
ncbi:ABC transporter ATP-binding protein [Pseudomarimonas arenosa]|uniref:ABC transporter ATP-binding protein n=1 Tax=Pseudomarimonas arenosa TaxID=2774145 RepID=A0AAW3ZRM0_9GAMM|nr:ABC transporter ATP-binding protein [Pseudomarimonas arenosa]MBD8526886.1 ABC transporter ATP-binding protein [Pseudomarimonas arenosa]